MKKEIPILFSTPMVQAILAGRKTKSRRVVKSKHVLYHLDVNKLLPSYYHNNDEGWCPFGKPGDLLWVRETLYQEGELGLYYVADNEQIDETTIPEDYTPYRNYACCKVPNIHMQKSVARMWLEVTDVTVERLQDIREEDAVAEGILPVQSYDSGVGVSGRQEYHNYLPHGYTEVPPLDSFESLWRLINGEESWNQNPWVWVVSFKVLSTTGKSNSTPNPEASAATEDAQRTEP